MERLNCCSTTKPKGIQECSNDFINPIDKIKFYPKSGKCFHGETFVGYGRMKDGILQITQNKIC